MPSDAVVSYVRIDVVNARGISTMYTRDTEIRRCDSWNREVFFRNFLLLPKLLKEISASSILRGAL